MRSSSQQNTIIGARGALLALIGRIGFCSTGPGIPDAGTGASSTPCSSWASCQRTSSGATLVGLFRSRVHSACRGSTQQHCAGAAEHGTHRASGATRMLPLFAPSMLGFGLFGGGRSVSHSIATNMCKHRRGSKRQQQWIHYYSWKVEKQLQRNVAYKTWTLYHDGVMVYAVLLQFARLMQFLQFLLSGDGGMPA